VSYRCAADHLARIRRNRVLAIAPLAPCPPLPSVNSGSDCSRVAPQGGLCLPSPHRRYLALRGIQRERFRGRRSAFRERLMAGLGGMEPLRRSRRSGYPEDVVDDPMSIEIYSITVRQRTRSWSVSPSVPACLARQVGVAAQRSDCGENHNDVGNPGCEPPIRSPGKPCTARRRSCPVSLVRALIRLDTHNG
jgi:hypothetical protein